MSLSSLLRVILLSCLIPLKVAAQDNDNDAVTAATLFPPQANTEARARATSSQLSNATDSIGLNCTGERTSSFSLELRTDFFPEETRWEIIDAFDASEVIQSTEYFHYKSKSSTYRESYCIPSESCYKIVMYDMFGDGIDSPGYYKFYYQDTVVMQRRGGMFQMEASDMFGDGCSSSSSAWPTISPSFPPFPSFQPPTSEPRSIPIFMFGIFIVIGVAGFFILVFWHRQRNATYNATGVTHNDNQQGSSTLEEQRQSRRFKVLTSIIHKKVLSKRKFTQEYPGEELILPHEKELSSRTLGAVSQCLDSSDGGLEQTAQAYHLSSIFPIAPPAPPASEEEGTDSDKKNTQDLKNDIFLTRRSLRLSQKSLSARSSLYSPRSCPICLEEYKVGDEIAWSNNDKCPHAFHLDCILDWLMENDDCPLCRGNYINAEEEC